MSRNNNITLDALRVKAAEGGNYPLAFVIAAGVGTLEQRVADMAEALRLIANNVKATPFLQAAIAMAPPLDGTVTTTPAPAAPKQRKQRAVKTKAKPSPVVGKAYFDAIAADPGKYGEGKTGYPAARAKYGLAPLTNAQKAARKALFAECEKQNA